MYVCVWGVKGLPARRESRLLNEAASWGLLKTAAMQKRGDE